MIDTYLQLGHTLVPSGLDRCTCQLEKGSYMVYRCKPLVAKYLK
jgi:hypothetical protein